ncbi:MAG: hypothetical protein Q8L15_18505 [Methylobacter sp.]|nr:hypothetical protein [Methylobacter sp.]
MTPIKYIGKRETYIDGCYGSKIEFAQGETKLIPADLANKFLRHPDQFEPGLEDDASAVVIPPVITKKDADEDTQDIRDSISNMDAESLQDFAMTNYRIKLDKRMKIDRMRNEVVRLVDQYGTE